MEDLMEDISCKMEALKNTVLNTIRDFKSEIGDEFKKVREEIKEMQEKMEDKLMEKADTSVNSMLEAIAVGGAEMFDSINEDLKEYWPRKRHAAELLSSNQVALVDKPTAENLRGNPATMFQ
ncbi:hypothetical protein LOTGIDRAFT_175562 [Lottia gigantea]|uniref:Uncharacterized protein n=1 Tax=Lottia gigantea TaxID=225164 RepID=V4A9M4_LOTGI|nr:hypothetical protein LOTGIDRAFT_175562 [Lottia gigantea]ESO93437.1 hypothetical protein LOTGIDRAFT_175562 [Lottia gigantea]